MASRTSILLLAFLLSCSAASAFNITKILGQNPDFSSFNSYLTQTQLADEINRRQTITVLAVDNSAISSISGQTVDVIKKVLSVHVILDYYDVDKIQNLKKKTALLTTLFQSSGLATAQMGFLNVTVTASGVQLGSAEPGAPLTAQVVKSVAAQPYNISVLQISSVIVPPGIQNANQSSNQTAPPPPAATPAAAPKAAASTPAASPKAAAVSTPTATPKAAPAPKKAPAPAASSPSTSTPAPAASSPKADSPSAASPPSPAAPTEAPTADSPSDDTPAPSGDAPAPSDAADAPAASSPTAGAPAGSVADAPEVDHAEAPAPSASSGSRVVFGTGLAAVMGAAVLAAF